MSTVWTGGEGWADMRLLGAAAACRRRATRTSGGGDGRASGHSRRRGGRAGYQTVDEPNAVVGRGGSGRTTGHANWRDAVGVRAVMASLSQRRRGAHIALPGFRWGARRTAPAGLRPPRAGLAVPRGGAAGSGSLDVRHLR